MEEFEIKDGKLIIYYKKYSGNSVVVPKDVKIIGLRAFERCPNLTNIILPQDLIGIEEAAFLNCRSLTSIQLPETLTWIDSGAFEGCKELISINLPEALNDIGVEYCTNKIPHIVPDQSIFSYCTNLINVNTNEPTFDKLNFDDQYLIVSNFARQYNINNIYTEEEINRYKNFIMLTKEKLLSKVIEKFSLEQQNKNKTKEEIIEDFIKLYIMPIIQNKNLLYFMCDEMNNVFTANELSELIRLSAKIHETETTGFLMDYKHRHFGEGNYLNSLSLEDGLDNSLNDNLDDSLGNSKQA